jgi:hypothetical protein
VSIRFSQGKSIESKGTITIKTLLSDINFYVMNILILFLLCLDDIDKLGIYLDNINNCMVKENIQISIFRKQSYL